MTANAAVAPVEVSRPAIMFVDDEQRVLKSMRAMFRRDYDVHLANSGAQALEILAENKIDVVVSDQRMPLMTGVEVLTEIKQRSPGTLRILLTGYADLAAVEASINDAEVFRYLMKPCPADEIRGAVKEGLALVADAADTPVLAVQPVSFEQKPGQAQTTETGKQARMEANPQSDAVDPPKAKPVSAAVGMVEVLVITGDSDLVSGVSSACAGHEIHQAPDVESGLELLRKRNVGVLVTDMSRSEEDIRQLSQQVRAITPGVVIIVASDRSDANVLIQMINSGQVFRFLLKPLQTGQCKIWLRSAIQRFMDSHQLMDGPLVGSGQGGNPALAAPTLWTRFRNWFLGVQN